MRKSVKHTFVILSLLLFIIVLLSGCLRQLLVTRMPAYKGKEIRDVELLVPAFPTVYTGELDKKDMLPEDLAHEDSIRNGLLQGRALQSTPLSRKYLFTRIRSVVSYRNVTWRYPQ